MANHQRSWTLPPSQKPVARLFIFHGTHEHCGKPCYAELAAAANARGIEAFAIDFHGHGLNTNGARGDFGPLDDAINEAVALVVKERGELPFAIFGHSLGSMVSFLAAHKLATDPSLPTPACVVLSGFAMDSVSPPFGVTALVPVLRAVPSVVRFVCAILSSVDPTGPACPLPPATELMRCPERAALTASDKLQYQGWIMNRTGVALLDARKRCNALLSEWGRPLSLSADSWRCGQIVPAERVRQLNRVAADGQAAQGVRGLFPRDPQRYEGATGEGEGRSCAVARGAAAKGWAAD